MEDGPGTRNEVSEGRAKGRGGRDAVPGQALRPGSRTDDAPACRDPPPLWAPPRWRRVADRPPLWADEMLGRLARYLRILGYDTVYRPGLSDDAVVAALAADPRLLVTRDRGLARRLPARSLLLTSTALPEQLRAVARTLPGFTGVPTFDRCTRCNGQLGPAPTDASGGTGGPTFVCLACRHVYWEGSHTARVRSDVARWLAAAPA